MAHLLLLAFILTMNSVSAIETDDNISATCLEVSERKMGYQEAKSFCSNVSQSCFVIVNRTHSLNVAKHTCSNVLTKCFNEVIKFKNYSIAAEACSDISNHCYSYYRKRNVSIEGSIELCRDGKFRDCNFE